MFDSSTSAYARASYTIDLAGLAVHARDTMAVYARRSATTLLSLRIELPRSRVGPTGRHYADYHVPDSARVR